MRRVIPRVALAVLFSAIIVVSAVLPAAAAGPVYRGPLDLSPFAYFPDMCSFPIHVTFDKQNATETVWVKPNGSVVWHLRGQVQSTWTNAKTGYSLWMNIPGPVTSISYPDGSTYLHFTGPQTPPGASPHWFMWGGEKVFITKDGGVTWTFNGRAEDICAALDHTP